MSAVATKQESASVAEAGARINYHREGSGPPLVLIHGVGLSWQIWRPVIGLLARDFDVIACDSPGFGGRRCPPASNPRSPSMPRHTRRSSRSWLSSARTSQATRWAGE